MSTTGTLAETLGVHNPLRYRGYVYDTETTLYYLQSRYYDPSIGRFINADAFASTGQGILGNNMFAYCNNNPVMFADESGYIFFPCAFQAGERSGRYPYIIDQDNESVGSKQFGLANVSHGGCGVIASYNALVTMGSHETFDDVLAYYNSRMGHIFGFGLMGLLPHNIGSYFTSLGHDVVITNQKEQIDALSKTADACIMYYEFPQTYNLLDLVSVNAYGAHFIEYGRTSGNYIGRNTSEGNGTYQFSSPYGYGTKGSRYYVVGIFIYK